MKECILEGNREGQRWYRNCLPFVDSNNLTVQIFLTTERQQQITEKLSVEIED